MGTKKLPFELFYSIFSYVFVSFFFNLFLFENLTILGDVLFFDLFIFEILRILDDFLIEH